MIHGMPDYNRDVRPKYGGSIQVSGSKWCTDNVVTLLAEISGKGMIYGGTVWLDHTDTQEDAEIMMKLDGGFIFSPSFKRMKEYGMYYPRSSIISLNKYDNVNFVYSVGLSYGITFESSFDLGYNEVQGEDLTVHYNLVYALI